MNENSIQSLLDELRESDIELWVEGQELKFRAPQGALTESLRSKIRNQKSALIAAWPWPEQLIGQAQLKPQFPRLAELSTLPLLDYHQGFWERICAGRPGINFTNLTNTVLRFPRLIDLSDVQRATSELTLRHPILSSVIRSTGDNYAFVFDSDVQVMAEDKDLSTESDNCREEIAKNVASACVWRPFRGGEEPLFRVFRIKLSKHDCIIGFVIHHFIADFVSVRIIQIELLAILEAIRLEIYRANSERAIGYPEYVSGLNAWLRSPGSAPSRRYWEKVLHEAPPTILPRNEHELPKKEAALCYHHFHIDSELSDKARQFATSQGVTLFEVLLAVEFFTLSAISKSNDITVLTFVMRRNDPLLFGVVGHLLNFLPLRSSISSNETFESLLKKVRALWSDAQNHISFPYHAIPPIHNDPEVGYANVFPMFNFIDDYRPDNSNNSDESVIKRFEINPSPTALHSREEFPTHNLIIFGTREGIHGTIEYLPWVHTPEVIANYAALFCRVLANICISPESTLNAAMNAQSLPSMSI
jgi:hypothetical protein